MLRYLIFIFLSISCLPVFSQQPVPLPTGEFAGPFTCELFLSTTRSDLSKIPLHHSFQSMYTKSKSRMRATAALKDRKMQLKWASVPDMPAPASYKVVASNPVIGTNFKGNQLRTWTPTDNALAVSKGGILVSCINYGIEYYKADGTPLLQDHTWTDFVNNTLLDQAKYDPRVLYDNLHDRFIVVLLHGFSSATSKVLVAFSKSGNPLDGWNMYQLPGNPFNDTSWSDYPNMGLNDDELFINLNRFGDAPDYNFNGTYLFQLALQEGYAGLPLQYGTWNNIQTDDQQEGLTLVAAGDGFGNSLKNTMSFVQLMPDSGSKVYVYSLNGQLNDPGKNLGVTSYPVPHYEVCANALQRDPTTGNPDSLSSGSAWAQNAYRSGNTIHYTHSADMGLGWCGVSYGRIRLGQGIVETGQFGHQGTDLAYPAVAAFGRDSVEEQAVFAFVRSDAGITPECGVVAIDGKMNWSEMKTVKAGDTCVNILYPPNYAVQPERWGDYTGICRRYGSQFPEVWMGASYGANTPPRPASYGTWLAKISPFHEPQKENGVLVYPNPVSKMFSIEFFNDRPGRVEVDLFDAAGKRVTSLFNDQLRESRNIISFNTLALATGVYFIKAVRDGKQIFNHKVLVKNP